jgi:hypothetical protein
MDEACDFISKAGGCKTSTTNLSSPFLLHAFDNLLQLGRDRWFQRLWLVLLENFALFRLPRPRTIPFSSQIL